MMDTISKVLNQCLKDFTALTTSDALTQYETEVSHRRWLDELGRLRVWSGNIGAHQVGQASLDYRLRDASHLKSETIKLLSRMLRILQEVREVVNGGNEGSEENVDIELDYGDDEDTDDMTEVQQLYQSLADIINLLFQISMAVRKPADHDRLLNMKIKNESYFEPWAKQHVSHKYPEAGSDLVSRLSAAMARQKAILKYREWHRAKLGKGLFECIETDSTGLSETEATEMAADNDQLHFLETASDSGLSQTSYATSLIATQDAVSIPNPPRESRDKMPFECPYCFHVITIKHKKDWARHVFRDLMPYACLSRDCSTPSKLYESRHLWFHHMREVHPGMVASQNGFTCPLCQTSVQPPASFEKHVGRHLEELALFVLPRTDLSEETNSEVSSPAASAVAARYDSNQSIGSGGIESDVGPGSSHMGASGVDPRDIQSLVSEQFGCEVDELIFTDEGEEQYSEHSRGVDVANAYSYTNPREQFERDSVARLSYDNRVSGEGPAEGRPRISRRLSGSEIFSKNQDISFQELIPGKPGRAAQSKRRPGFAPAYDAYVSNQHQTADYSSDLKLENNGGRPRKPTHPSRNRLASPPKDIKSSDEKQGIEAKPSTDADTLPRGILKPAGARFPEVHNLKDVLKEGIPPGARWTKIDRRFVNPAALEAGHERYEERPDHVIVLRVLSKEEIQAYALKTQETRAARYQEYLEE